MCVQEVCLFILQVIKRTEGQYTGRISLNSPVDLPAYIYKSMQSKRVMKKLLYNVCEEYVHMPAPVLYWLVGSRRIVY